MVSPVSNSPSDATNNIDSSNANGPIGFGQQLVSMMDEIMLKLTQLLQDFIKMLRKYSIKQQNQEWEIVKASIQSKEKSIEKKFQADSAAANAMIAANVISAAGSAFGANSDAEHVGKGRMGLADGFAKGIEGIVKRKSAEMERDASMDNVASDLQQKNSESYKKGMVDLQDLIQKFVSNMTTNGKDFVDIFGRISSALQAK